jgi:AcrR family transcriptional regulator
MSTRRYHLGMRQIAADQTRLRILEAARALLAAEGGFSGFTIDAVARQADVARMTVYHQFGSKVGLLEGLCDLLALRGGMEGMAEAFCQPTALAALDAFIAVLGRFWDSDRLVMRRMHALAALDPEIAEVAHGRFERRREGSKAMVRRLAREHGLPEARSQAEAAELLFAVTGFATFDALAGEERTLVEVVPQVRRLARAALGLREE